MLYLILALIVFGAGGFCVLKNCKGRFQWFAIEVLWGIPIFIFFTDLAQFVSNIWPGNLYVGASWLIFPSLALQFLLIVPNLVLHQDEINDCVNPNNSNKSSILKTYSYILKHWIPENVVDGILSHRKDKEFFSFVMVSIVKFIAAFISAFYIFSGHRIDFSDIVVNVSLENPGGWLIFIIIFLAYVIVIYTFHKILKEGLELLIKLNKDN